MAYRRKYRRCSDCGVVRPAGDFERVRSDHFAAELRRCCPACGHVAPWWSFAEVGSPEKPGERES